MLNDSMEAGGPSSSSAVDVPVRRVELQLGRRRHRRITGPAGLLLFICLFLPAVRGCNDTVYPLSMPMFWHPYLYGLVFAVATASLTLRSVRYAVVALRILAWLTIVGGAILLVVAGALGIGELALGAILLAAIGRRGFSERRVALTAIAIGACSLLWFGLWAATPDALIGVYLSVLASGGMLAGGLVWLGELATGRPVPIVVPRALARERE
jgi:hypothetical protein